MSIRSNGAGASRGSSVRSTYKALTSERLAGGRVRLTVREPDTTKARAFKNLGIAGMKGREDLFVDDGRHELYVKSTQAGRVAWYDFGHDL